MGDPVPHRVGLVLPAGRLAYGVGDGGDDRVAGRGPAAVGPVVGRVQGGGVDHRRCRRMLVLALQRFFFHAHPFPKVVMARNRPLTMMVTNAPNRRRVMDWIDSSMAAMRRSNPATSTVWAVFSALYTSRVRVRASRRSSTLDTRRLISARVGSLSVISRG